MGLLSKPKFSKRNFGGLVLRRKGLAASVLSVFIGGGYLAHVIYSGGNLSSYFHSSHQPDQSGPSYIYLDSDSIGPINSSDEEKNGIWFTWRRSDKHLHWRLLKLAHSKDQNIRHIAIKALAELPNLKDPEYLEIAQASDLQTSIGLARTMGADSKFFLSPPPESSEKLHHNVESEFRMLLASLPKSDINPCVQYFTQNAIQGGFLITDDSGGEWCFGGEGLSVDHGNHPRRVPSETVEKFCLQALLSHSTVSSHRRLMIEKGVLQLLQRVYSKRYNNIALQSIIAQIIGNLSLDESSHRQLFMAGWIGILHSWIHSTQVQLSFPACRALANLDRDSVFHVFYEDGVYPLYPQYRGRESSIQADVIFVHGLLGGVFRTWRQHDSKKCQKENASKAEDNDHTKDSGLPSTLRITANLNKDNYTYCWPKDWLAHDFPHLRLIGVDYDTHLSDWRAKCPVDQEKHTLQSRGNDILKKLVLAGVGEKPVIWIAHSMGGLLVKQMLLEAATSEDPIIKAVATNTVGVVFYSVPHKGTEMVNFKPSMELLLLPSVEVKELKNSSHLLKAHEMFIKLVENNNIPCLSFGEAEKSVLGLKWSALLVPAESADPGCGKFHLLPVDHLNTCKPENPDSPSYRILVDFINSLIPHSLMKTLVPNVPSAKDIETSVVMGLMQ